MNTRILGKAAVFGGLVLAVIFGTVQCSKKKTNNYNGAGSRWTVAMTGTHGSGGTGDCTINKFDTVASTTASMTITCTYTVTADGFYSLTVASSSGTGAPAAGSTAWAVAVDGFALLLQPVDSNSADQMVAMVKSGSCPSADFTANWVMVRQDASGAVANSTTNDWFGTFAWTNATSTGNLPTKYALDSSYTAVSGGAGDMTGTCSNGVMTVDGTADMYLTADGGALVQGTSGDIFTVFAISQQAVSNVANLNASYACIMYDGNASAGSRINAVAGSLSAGTGTFSVMSDVANSTASGTTYTVNLNGTPDSKGDGFITGTLTDSSSNVGNMGCAVDVSAGDNNKAIFSCAAQVPAAPSKNANLICAQI